MAQRILVGRREDEVAYEETRANCCTRLSCVAGRGATTAARCRRPDKHVATPQYRCYLRRRNDRDFLQRTHQPERGWLRIEWRDRIEQRVRIERGRWQQHIVRPAMPRFSAGQRTVQLIGPAVRTECARGLTLVAHRFEMERAAVS
jgi:hypothetical protein